MNDVCFGGPFWRVVPFCLRIHMQTNVQCDLFKMFCQQVAHEPSWIYIDGLEEHPSHTKVLLWSFVPLTTGGWYGRPRTGHVILGKLAYQHETKCFQVIHVLNSPFERRWCNSPHMTYWKYTSMFISWSFVVSSSSSLEPWTLGTAVRCLLHMKCGTLSPAKRSCWTKKILH